MAKMTATPDQRIFTASPETFDEFERLCSTPLPGTTKLEQLFERPSPFDRPAAR